MPLPYTTRGQSVFLWPQEVQRLSRCGQSFFVHRTHRQYGHGGPSLTKCLQLFATLTHRTKHTDFLNHPVWNQCCRCLPITLLFPHLLDRIHLLNKSTPTPLLAIKGQLRKKSEIVAGRRTSLLNIVRNEGWNTHNTIDCVGIFADPLRGRLCRGD